MDRGDCFTAPPGLTILYQYGFFVVVLKNSLIIRAIEELGFLTKPEIALRQITAARGKISMGWFFGFKLHLVFNHLHEIMAVKLTPPAMSMMAPRWSN